MCKDDLKKLIILHKILSKEISDGKFTLDDNFKLYSKQQITGEELAIVLSEFKCETCKSEQDLTFHHMVERKNKEFTTFHKYFSQRRYYLNLVILCRDCHTKLNRYRGKGKDNLMKTIAIDRINELKLRWLQS